MSTQRLTYDDKVGINPKETRINQVWDDDMNDIKEVVNWNADSLDTNTTNIASNASDISDLQDEVEMYFTVESDDTLSVPDYSTPTFIPNIFQVNGINGFTLDSSTGSVINTSGKDLIMRGSLAVQYERSGVGDTDFYIYSQSSTDGVTWTAIDGSLRHILVDRDGIGYKSIASFTDTVWTNGTYVRFMFGINGNTLELKQLTETLGSETVSGHSFFWSMKEQ